MTDHGGEHARAVIAHAAAQYVQALDEDRPQDSGTAVFRAMQSLREALAAVPGHAYLSTGCLHDKHDYCRSAQREDGGVKVPASCKFCGAPCICPCHEAAPQPIPPRAWYPPIGPAGR